VRRGISQELWLQLNRSYGRIHDARSGARLDPDEKPLEADELDELRADLKQAADGFAKQIRSLRFWLLPEAKRRG
jgi:hypothetical protein